MRDDSGDVNEAFKYAKLAKEKSPENPGIMDTMGLAYYNKELYGNAVNEFLDSLQKLPDNAEIHYHLGMAYNKKGDLEKAIKEQLINTIHLPLDTAIETVMKTFDSLAGTPPNDDALLLIIEKQ